MIKISRLSHSQEIEILRSILEQAVEQYGLDSREALRASMELDVPVTREQTRRLWNYGQSRNAEANGQGFEAAAGGY